MNAGYVPSTDMPVDESARSELLDANEEEIRGAVEYADPMVLRGLLYQLTGEDSLKVPEGPGIANAEDIAALRARAVAFLRTYRDSGAGAIDSGPRERLHRSLSLTAGADIPVDQLDQYLEELALDPWSRGLEWTEKPSARALESFSVVVIGAGMGGLNAAVQLKRAGINFTAIEKNSGVGGTWFENRYPGARLDTESRSYTHIYGANFTYSARYNEWRDNQRYFDWVADTFDLRGDIVFDTEVVSLVWDDAASAWDVTTEGPQGRRMLRANAVISAVGFLNRPNVPDIEGSSEFRGQAHHSARWPERVDITGKRVAVIGTGCTGYQMIPELALEAEHVYVFQRTPQWLFPVAGYRSPFPAQVTWLDRNFPYYTNFARVHAFGNNVYSLGYVTDIDPEFKDPYSRSAVGKAKRDDCIAFLTDKFEKQPDLLDKMIPSHPVYSARPVIVDTEYGIADALLRENVTLVTDGIQKINRTGIEAKSGTQYDADVIVYATGFKANEYLWPMEVRGRGGKRVEQLWAQTGAQAYLGTMLPGFPNFWMIYGPNTNGGLPVAAFHEITTRFALECMQRLILGGGQGSIDVTDEAYQRYNEEVDRRNEMKVWSDPRANNYWGRNEFGRTSNRNPFRGTELWRFLRHPNFDELIVRNQSS
jgi:4-hydroxyacetophenone monooxygenase